LRDVAIVNAPLVSPKTRLEFREYFVGTSIARVDDAFMIAGIECRHDHIPACNGARRGRVEQYYASLDFSKRSDVRRLLLVYEHVLDEVEEQLKHGDEHSKRYSERTLESLLRCVRRDGLDWVAGRLVSVSRTTQLHDIHDAISSLAAPELGRQLERLRDAVDDDPALAIGTAKEMLETTCKTILEESGCTVLPEWDVPELLKATRKQLKLLPEDVPDAARGAETIRKLLGSLGQIGHGLAELRNLYGSGHGRSGRAKGLSSRHARLAVGAVATLVQFLFETHRERKTSS
jgi:hypothetical protein